MTTTLPTPHSIRQYAEHAFLRYIKQWVNGNTNDRFPLTVPRSSVRLTDYGKISELQRVVEDLKSQAKSDERLGYTVVVERRRARGGGENEEIAKIRIDSEADLVWLANQREQFQQFKLAVSRLRSQLPELDDWIRRCPRKLLASLEFIDGLIEVVDYLKKNPRPGVFARELPLSVETKFLEQHQGILDAWLSECPRELRVFGEDDFFAKYGMRNDRDHHAINVLDPDLQTEFSIPFKELSLSMRDLRGLRVKGVRVIFVENRINLLTLPPLKRTIGVDGKGKYVNQYASLPWLSSCESYYWGDMDVEGFGILASFRAALRNHGLETRLPSLMMDQASFDRFSKFAVSHTPSKVAVNLEFLSVEERSLLEMLLSKKRRLEQERLSQPYIAERLSNFQY